MNKTYILALIIATRALSVLELSFKSCDAPMKCFHYKDADSRSTLETLEGCAKNST